MSSIKNLLTALFSDAFAACGVDRKFGEVVLSQRPDLSQFQCNGALPAARALGQNPRELAEKVLANLNNEELFADLSLAGPGFINITLQDQYLADYLQSMQADARMLCSSKRTPNTVIIDFGGPNVAKAMHVGHLRSSIIGDSLQRLFRFVGDTVTSDIHLGDWGTQMGMLICELKRRQPELVYFDKAYPGPYPETAPVTIADLEEMYPIASSRCKADEQELQAALQATVELQQGRPGYRALWQHFCAISIAALQRDFAALGINFDCWFGESRYHDRIPAMLEKLKAASQLQLSEGAWIIEVAQASDSKPMPPLILVKSDGGYLYATTDLATIEERVVDFQADTILYVVDKRQSLHFEQVFRAAKLTGIADNTDMEHLAFGTVNGSDGKPFKTRQGGVMKLQDLITMATEQAKERMSEAGVAQDYTAEERSAIANQVGIAALKFADLINFRLNDYVFNLEKFTRFDGKTGPYLLYAAVRIKSILQKAAERSILPGTIIAPLNAERELVLELSKFPDAVQEAYDKRAPNSLCEFAYNLAQVFSRFYQACHILNEEDQARRASWLGLASLCLRQLEQTLYLLGIEVPNKM